MIIQYINSTELLASFLKDAGNSLKTFRYFEKRNLNVIKNHIVTCLGIDSDLPIAYGHLDKDDNDKIWLGICVKWTERGKGYGKQMMDWLIKYIKINKLREIYLAVDTNNLQAIKMYKKYNFSFIKTEKNIEYYILRIT